MRRDERLSAARRVGGERLPERAALSTGSPGDRVVNARNNLPGFAEDGLRERDVRRVGVAGQDMSHVSPGLLDGCRGRGAGPRDRAAGGVTTTWSGTCRQPGDDARVAGDDPVHDGVPSPLVAVHAAGGATVR